MLFHAFIIAIEFILGVIFALVVLHLGEVLSSAHLVQIELFFLELGEMTIILLRLLEGLLLVLLLLIESLSVIASFLDLDFTLLLVILCVLPLLVEESLSILELLLLFLLAIDLGKTLLL